MKESNILLRKKISRILDEWDPIGINKPKENIFYNEYDAYIDEVINRLHSKELVYNYLIELYGNLLDKPNNEGVYLTKIAVKKIFSLTD